MRRPKYHYKNPHWLWYSDNLMVDNGKSWLATFQVLQGPVEDPQWCYSIWEALWDLHWTAWKGGESRQQRKVGRMLSIFWSDLWNGNERVVSCFSGIQKNLLMEVENPLFRWESREREEERLTSRIPNCSKTSPSLRPSPSLQLPVFPTPSPRLDPSWRQSRSRSEGSWLEIFCFISSSPQ